VSTIEPGRHPLVLLAMSAIAIAAGVASLAPASLLDSRLARATGGVLRLASTQGTLWHGRGVVTDADMRLPVEWDVDPWPLFRGVLHMRVRSDAGAESPRAILDLGTDGITLRDADVTVPATAIGRALGDMTAGSIDGEVNASAASLHLAAGSSSGEARLVWRNARIRGVGTTAPLDLGEIRTTLAANGATLSGPVGNDGGSLALRGEWALKERDAFTLALRATPRKPGDAELVRWLSAVGTPDGDGWRINWRVPLQ
jgi:hypothetical protein